MNWKLCFFAAAALGASTVMAGAQSRYTPPQPAPLSADLAQPWILQLRNKPRPDGRMALEIARPQLPRRHLPQARLRTGFNAFTPSRAVPTRPPQAPAQPASVQRQAAPDRNAIDPKFEVQTVAYDGPHGAGTIVIDTSQRFLYLVREDGTARRYGIGVGRSGFEWSGTEKITRKAEWPGWTPPEQMREREAARGHILPRHMKGGPENPLGARALYLGGTLYRIHGTNQPWTIGQAVSSGCIRMRNEDVIELYERVSVGTRVVVR